jgi:hypothetical protein
MPDMKVESDGVARMRLANKSGIVRDVDVATGGIAVGPQHFKQIVVIGDLVRSRQEALGAAVGFKWLKLKRQLETK